MNNETPVTFHLEIARSQDVNAIVDYYHDSARPSTVFERTREAISRTVDQGLFLLLKDGNGNVVAASAIYAHKKALRIGSSQQNQVTSNIVFAEIGSLWRRAAGPKGFVRELMYSASTLRAIEEAHNLLINTMVTQIVASELKTVQNLLKLSQGWSALRPDKQFQETFRGTVADDTSKTIKLQSFVAPVATAITGASKELLGQTPGGKFQVNPKLHDVIVANDVSTGRNVHIYMGDTGILETAQRILDNNNQLQALSPTTSWAEAAQALLQPAAYPVPQRRDATAFVVPKGLAAA